jgi:hypothetical protein
MVIFPQLKEQDSRQLPTPGHGAGRLRSSQSCGLAAALADLSAASAEFGSTGSCYGDPRDSDEHPK